jgi:hypothetical protein
MVSKVCSEHQKTERALLYESQNAAVIELSFVVIGDGGCVIIIIISSSSSSSSSCSCSSSRSKLYSGHYGVIA